MAGKELELGGTVHSSIVDSRILELADSSSPEEISRDINKVYSPAGVAARLQTLLKSRDWLTATQEDLLVTWKMKRALLELEKRFMDIDNAKMRLAFLKAIGARLDNRQAATETDLTKLYNNQGALLGRVVDQALAYMKGALREKVDPDLWDDLVKEALLSAQAELAKFQAVEE